MPALKRLWPILPVLAVLAVAYAFGAQRTLTWAALGQHEAALRGLVQARPVAMAAGYLALYTAAVAVSFPGAIILTVSGGLLFGTIAGAALTVVAATAGSCLIFLAARTALAPTLAARAGSFLDRVRSGLQRDAFSYIVALRLIPVVPFWLVNLAPAVLGVGLAPFAAGTFLGIIPATTIYSALGAGIADVLAAGGRPDLGIVLTPPVLLPLLGLAALALAPVLWRIRKTRNAV